MIKSAIILTNAEVTEEETKLLRGTNILKVALNSHAEELLPSARFTSDYIVKDLARRFSQPIFCTRVISKLATTVNEDTLGCSIGDCIKWLDGMKVRGILLVATNRVHTEGFQELVYNVTRDSMYRADIYKYSPDAYFDAPYMSVKDFLEVNCE